MQGSLFAKLLKLAPQFAKPTQMLFRAGAVAMVRNDAGEIEGQGGCCTLRELLRNGIEDVGREVSDAAIAGKEVGGEQQPKALTVEPHVSVSVAGKMHRPQPVPHIDEVSVVEPPVRGERTKAQQRSANSFQPARDSGPAVITRITGVMFGIQTRSRNPGPSFACEAGHVEDVIEVSVGNDDPTNRITLPTALAECALQKEASANEPSVEQI